MPVSFPLPDPSTWFSNVLVTSGLIKTNIIDPVNLLARGFIGENDTSATTTLTTAATNVVHTATVTFTLTDQRRVRIDTNTQFQTLGSNGIYFSQAAYNSGATASLGSAITVGPVGTASITSTGLRASIVTGGTVLLAAGQYTAYMLVQRQSGGASTDTARFNQVIVTDVGAV